MAARGGLKAWRRVFGPVRLLSERAGGVGGLWQVAGAVRPGEEARRRGHLRLRGARAALQERALPAELRERRPLKDEDQHRDFVEARIQAAMKDGQFENLAGRGKPLPRPETDEPDPALALALRILKRNNVRPPWIDLMHRIDAERRDLRAQLRGAWRAHMGAPGGGRPHRWELAVRVAAERMKDLNKRIDHFNLTKPRCMLHLFRLRMRMPEEIQRAQGKSVAEEDIDRYGKKEPNSARVNGRVLLNL